MELTAENVKETGLACMFSDEEIGTKTDDEMKAIAIVSEGITVNFVFSPDKIKQQKENIKSLLSQLPDEFMKSGGGGWSFLNACVTKNGTQWGEHRIMETLFCLGEAAGIVQLCMPREMWDILPGGMPFYTIDLEK